jgi:uncharacterized protein DUF6176
MPDQVVCHRIKLRAGSLPRVRKWAGTIRARRAEALATLREEGVAIESAFLEESPDGHYLIYYMRGSKLLLGAAASSAHPIDEYHREFKRDTWEGGSELELLIDLEVSAE